MRFDKGGDVPITLLNTILAVMVSVHEMTGSAVAGFCAGAAVPAALADRGGRRPGG